MLFLNFPYPDLYALLIPDTFIPVSFNDSALLSKGGKNFMDFFDTAVKPPLSICLLFKTYLLYEIFMKIIHYKKIYYFMLYSGLQIMLEESSYYKHQPEYPMSKDGKYYSSISGESYCRLLS